MKTKLFGTVCVLSALAVVACGDDDSGEGGSGGSTTTTTGTGTTATGTGTTTSTKASSTATGSAACPLPDTTAPATCDDACSDLYDCGALTCNGATLCAFTGDAAEKTAFVDGCIETCMGQMALISFIDPADCAATIDTISGVSTDFAGVCADGIGQGGGGN